MGGAAIFLAVKIKNIRVIGGNIDKRPFVRNRLRV